jgi:hypothetical protein
MRLRGIFASLEISGNGFGAIYFLPFEYLGLEWLLNL